MEIHLCEITQRINKRVKKVYETCCPLVYRSGKSTNANVYRVTIVVVIPEAFRATQSLLSLGDPKNLRRKKAVG